MKKTLFALSMILLCAYQAQAAETQALEEAGIDSSAITSGMAETNSVQPFVINISWKNFIDSAVTTNLSRIEPAAGASGDGSVEDGFTVSLTDQILTSPTPPKFELAYTTRRNLSLRTKHSGIMLTKKFKFEPTHAANTLPDTGEDIGKPQFSE